MPQQISEQTTDMIVRGLDKLCDAIEEGATPNDAAYKIARDGGYTAGQVEMLCRGYNAGAINAQRRDSGTFGEKFAAVAQADADLVNQKLFPKTAKAAHAIATPVAAVYRSKPGANAIKAASQAPEGKPAERDWLFPAGPKNAYFTADATPYRIATAKLAALKEERYNLNRAEANAASKTAAVEDAIRHTYKDPTKYIPWLRKVAAAYYGDTGRKIVEKVAASFMPGYRHAELMKSPSELIPTEQTAPIDFTRGPLLAVKTAVEAIQAWAEREVAFTKSAFDTHSDIYRTYGAGAAEEATKIAFPGKTAKESADARWNKKAGFLAGALGGLSSKTLAGAGGSPPDNSKLINARLTLNDPSHSAELKSIRAEAMLNDLVNNDEVISSYSPDEVALAFMELSQSAPDAVDNAALLRANMRRNLSGNLTTHEAKQLSELRSPKLEPDYSPQATSEVSANAQRY